MSSEVRVEPGLVCLSGSLGGVFRMAWMVTPVGEGVLLQFG